MSIIFIFFFRKCNHFYSDCLKKRFWQIDSTLTSFKRSSPWLPFRTIPLYLYLNRLSTVHLLCQFLHLSDCHFISWKLSSYLASRSNGSDTVDTVILQTLSYLQMRKRADYSKLLALCSNYLLSILFFSRKLHFKFRCTVFLCTVAVFFMQWIPNFSGIFNHSGETHCFQKLLIHHRKGCSLMEMLIRFWLFL